LSDQKKSNKTFIYLIPKRCNKKYNPCTELIIINEFIRLGYHIIPIYHLYIINILFLVLTRKIDGIIVNSINILWKNRLLLKLNLTIPIYWWYFDTAMVTQKRVKKVNKIAPQINIFFNKDRGEFHRYHKMGAKPIWLDQGAESVCNFVETEKQEFDLGFIGGMSHIHKERTSILRELDKKYNLAIYTPHEMRYKKNGFKNVYPPILHAEFGKVASKIRIMLNLSVNNTQPFYWSNRIHLLLGSGAFCISEYVEGIEESYTNEKDCLFFHNLNELYKLIDYWIQENMDGAREKIRHQGHLTAQKKHSYKNRIIKFLKHLDTKNYNC